jgi:hypothetical protein
MKLKKVKALFPPAHKPFYTEEDIKELERLNSERAENTKENS